MPEENDKPVFRFVAGKRLEDLSTQKTQPVESIPTPLPTWNALCGEEGGHVGLAKTWTIIVGGMPGSRKSYFALNLAAHAVKQGHKVGAINFEMSFEGYATRYLSILSGVNKDDLGWGSDFRQKEFDRARKRANEILRDKGGALITNEATAFTLDDIKAAYRAFAEKGVDIVIVDYVQLVRASGLSDMKERAGAIAETLRECSHKYKVVTVALSQVNREGMKKSDRPPRMTDLYGGMFWEANANQVLLLDHTHQEQDRVNGATLTRVIIDKNRHGENMVEVDIRWDWDTMEVEEYDGRPLGEKELIDSAPPGSFDTDEDEAPEDEEPDDLSLGV